jgi:hypothetical protein
VEWLKVKTLRFKPQYCKKKKKVQMSIVSKNAVRVLGLIATYTNNIINLNQCFRSYFSVTLAQ